MYALLFVGVIILGVWAFINWIIYSVLIVLLFAVIHSMVYGNTQSPPSPEKTELRQEKKVIEKTTELEVSVKESAAKPRITTEVVNGFKDWQKLAPNQGKTMRQYLEAEHPKLVGIFGRDEM